MKTTLFIILISMLTSYVFAQDKFTYVEDKTILKPADFFGYSFVPNQVKINTSFYPDDLDLGVVSFNFKENSIVIKEDLSFNIKGIKKQHINSKKLHYSISKIDREKYGYNIQLISRKNKDIQGNLKCILNKALQVEFIIFKPDNIAHERQYALKKMSPEEKEAINLFFTPKDSLIIEEVDSLWENTIYPFAQYYSSPLDIKYNRIYSNELISFDFKKIKVIKGKKEKLLPFILLKVKTMDGEYIEKKFLFKKSKSTTLMLNKKVEKNVLHFICKDELANTSVDIYMILNKKNQLSAIKWMNTTYFLSSKLK